MRKTIQYNPADYEAYKLLVKICLKNNETEEVLELLHTRLEEEENGDLYYCLARVYKFIGDLDEYYENLKNALENPYTLSYSKKALHEEMEFVGSQIGRHEEIEPERTVEEYNAEDEDSEEDENTDDSYDEFDEFDEDEEENEDDDEESYEEFDEDDEPEDEYDEEEQQYDEVSDYEETE